MSDYGADSNPDREAARYISQHFNLFPLEFAKLDVYTIDSDYAVYKFVNKQSKSRLLVKVDRNISPFP